MKMHIRTIKTMPNLNVTKARQEAQEIAKQYPDFVEVNGLGGTWRDYPEARGCDKLTIKAWYWRGEWSQPTKEVFRMYYKPKK